VVIADGLNSQRTLRQENQAVADVTILNDALAFRLFGKTKLGVAYDFHQVGMTHAMKERELQQLVV
jgi:hypothetical protein